MLIAYQAKITGNQIHWIDTPPDVSDVDVLILPKQKSESPKPKRQIPASLKGRGKTNGDIMDTSDIANTKPKRTPPPELKGMMTFNDDIWDTSEIFAEWEHFK